MPRASAGLPPRKKRHVGAQREADSHQVVSRHIRSPKRLSASSTLAASELPPPMPPPSGMRFVSAMSTPERHALVLLQRRGGANREIVSGATPASSARAPNRSVVATRERDRVARSRAPPSASRAVIAVVATTRHVQEQLSLPARDGQAAHATRRSRLAPAIDDDAEARGRDTSAAGATGDCALVGIA
jgi:hypothetical protein